LSGVPGVCLVSRGPGATHAAIAVHAAEQDAAPFILLIGQVERRHLRRGAFQEIDYRGMFGGIAKFVAEPTDPERLPEVMARAFQAAVAGTPGPVVVALPQDILGEAIAAGPVRPQPRATSALDEHAVAESLGFLAAARRPLLIAGGGIGRDEGRRLLRAAAEAWGIPVLTSFRRHDLFPGDHPLSAGELGLTSSAAQHAAWRESDLVLAVGTRLGDITTRGYSFPETPEPQQPLIHVHEDPAVLGRHARARIPIAGDPAAFLARLAGANRRATTGDRAGWSERLHGLRRAHARWEPRQESDGIVFGNLVAALQPRLAADAFLAVDAGTSVALLYRHLPLRAGQRLLASVTGTMGWSAPAAIVAALRHPGRPILCIAGDGGFLMTGNELAFMVERRLPIRIILANNASLGSIRFQQERDFPGRQAGTDLAVPDFARWAQAFGCEAERVSEEAAVGAALDRLLAADGPFLLEVRTSLAALIAAARG
jgi:acetolactate synthase-1/2/3 large subunit